MFNQDDIYDDGSETLALEQEILAEYLYFFEVDDDSLDKYEMLKYRQIGKKFCVLDKEQFLRYEDDCYFKKTPDFLEMRSFLRNETGLSKEDADDYANDIMICFEAQPDNSEESVYEVSWEAESTTVMISHSATESLNICVKKSCTQVPDSMFCSDTLPKKFSVNR